MILRQDLAIARLPVLIGAVSCVVLARFRLVGFLYLAPLGVMAAGYGFGAAWRCLFWALIGNGFWSTGTAVFYPLPLDHAAWNIIYFSLLAVAFTWMMAPSLKSTYEPAEKTPVRISGVWRFVIAACAAALLFLPLIVSLRQDETFGAFIRAQAEALSDFYAGSAGADVMEESVLKQYLTPDFILQTLISTALRGGAAASCMALFLINRQIALVMVRIFRRIKSGAVPEGFHAPQVFIWVLSFSLLGILAGKKWAIIPLEIAAWNGLVVCGILYMVQGGSIALYFITRANFPPFMRLLLNFLLFFLIISPGINAIFLGCLILLGIAENWAPFRAPKINESSSTPGM
ncbi:MAG: DUF2232 domain-containing protein [Treponema sp.]|jgi:hypothetical protein|nr:DUF2232 domain-containing protein [Treponema sp.]